MKDEQWERQLRELLANDHEPDEQLNKQLIDRMRERKQMKPLRKKRWSAALLTASLLLILSVSAYAATQLYNAPQIAENAGDRLLAEAFASDDALRLEESVISGDYRFTLHGLVTGAGISDLSQGSEQDYPDRTYAIVSIAKADGSAMPNPKDIEPAEYQESFFVSPLIQGVKPWQANIVTMDGSYTEQVIDGVLYRIIDCDQIEMFADRGVVLAVSSGSPFYSNDAFHYDEATGVVEARTDYSGAAALFDLPLDPSKADPTQAEAYLNELLQPSAEQTGDDEASELPVVVETLRAQLHTDQPIEGIIPESVAEVTYDEKGNIRYSYDDYTAIIPLDELFEEGQTGYSLRYSVSGSDQGYTALLFHKDAQGVITGRIAKLGLE
ncbi:hypothetical protein PA598K_06599 [Paenibacillus sp. 598K]|nr:hypothetical protein PA598K_06599 [Paenibacillus sp. 598K]